MFAGLNPPSLSREYQQCNFSQKTCIDDAGSKRGHRLFPGDDTPRIFIGCNMTNCEPPPGSTCIKCNGTITSFAIIDSTETISIDGEDIVAKNYVNIVYGNYKDGQYNYKSVPLKIPIKHTVVEV